MQRYPLIGSTVIALALVAAPTAAQRTSEGDSMTISRQGSRTVRPGSEPQFTGTVRIEMLFPATDTTRASGALVTFEAGARTAWHAHPRGQTLIVTVGTGRIQRRGGTVEEIQTGDVIWIPAGVEHWHGASPTAAMSHIAIQESLAGGSMSWGDEVTDAEYGAVPRRSEAARPTTPGPYADIAPALDDYTQRVLYGDVWERPGLSKRDRSLATVAALVALGRQNELSAHLRIAQRNGLTRDELIEAITHLAFYAGWPSANTAIMVARQVFGTASR